MIVNREQLLSKIPAGEEVLPEDTILEFKVSKGPEENNLKRFNRV